MNSVAARRRLPSALRWRATTKAFVRFGGATSAEARVSVRALAVNGFIERDTYADKTRIGRSCNSPPVFFPGANATRLLVRDRWILTSARRWEISQLINSAFRVSSNSTANTITPGCDYVSRFTAVNLFAIYFQRDRYNYLVAHSLGKRRTPGIFRVHVYVSG